VAVTGDLDNQTKIALQKFDNRFEAQSQSIDADLFLNLYFSVPIESPAQSQPVTQTTAGLDKDHVEDKEGADDASEEDNDASKNDNLPSVKAILNALAPEQIKQTAATRGSGGKHKLKKQIPHRRLEIDLLIPFELNQHTITPAAAPFLDRLGRALSADVLKGSLFEIQGHTCNMGRSDYNLWLSQKRAEAVKDYLTTHFGFQSNQLRAVGYGMQQPKYSNDTEENRAKNRRVTIVNTQRAVQKYHKPLKLQVEANYIRGGREVKIENGISLTPDDNYALSFSADQPCHVYVFQIDSKTTVAQLFPNADYNSRSNPIGPKKKVRLPDDEEEWFYLDDTRGTEELIVIAYPEPIKDPVAVAKSLAGQYEANLFPFAPNEKGADTRGPGGVRIHQAPNDLLFVWKSQFFNER
jgi:outer membrane protein OmpA-like peptidoglycan-associated protein